MTNIFNTFSIENVPNFGTKVDERYLCNASNISDPIKKAIQKSENHPSIPVIKKQWYSEGDYMIPACRDEISTHPAETDFTLQLHVEIRFRPGKAGLFSTCYLIRFACAFFGFFSVSMLFYKTEDISQQIKRLDINKACTQESDIPTKLVKRFDNLIVDYLKENLNNYLEKGTFPKDF